MAFLVDLLYQGFISLNIWSRYVSNEAKICKFEFALFGDENIVWFEIAVYITFFVHLFNC
jgi:hypothetical protein